MNDNMLDEDELRTLLAPSDQDTPLDPARVIAGAQRRRQRRGLAAVAASVTVVAFATGAIAGVAWSRQHGDAPEPARPAPTTIPAPTNHVPTTPVPTTPVPTNRVPTNPVPTPTTPEPPTAVPTQTFGGSVRTPPPAPTRVPTTPPRTVSPSSTPS